MDTDRPQTGSRRFFCAFCILLTVIAKNIGS